eukprot:gnl/MRDRNA2_/MRDRNA2_69440_c0_seq1.p1 gnl/MRDRNA2_/MRDRNA2_69440_c0~~gnl/MRDRNA2_/MRDRNA2_69440_c0_seq1.p1  ORF type:complete len:604 (+),score=168.23 gnl/MRDRNA2_/MRDRNA2_69440_c0_seq1:2-1813(+)
MLMQDSLGGTAKTLMFVNCSPASSNVEESEMSLKWAQRAKEVRNEVVAHEGGFEEAGDSEDLETAAKQDLLSQAEALLEKAQRDGSASAQEIQTLQDQVRQYREEIASLTTQKHEAEERLQYSVLEKQRAEEEAAIQKSTYEMQLENLELSQKQLVAQTQGEIEESRRMMEAAQAEAAEKQPTIDHLSEKIRFIEERFEDEQKLRKKFHNQIQDMKGAIRVFCRWRPMSQRELDLGDACVVEKTDAFTIEVAKPSKGGGGRREEPKSFVFDSVFHDRSSQEDVFADCKDLVSSVIDGYNVTVFAYGQTGSGKTHTMYGSQQQPGLAPRTINELYRIIRKEENNGKRQFNVKMYMVELYKQNLVDLLSDLKAKDRKNLEVKRDIGRQMMYIENVTEKSVSSPEECLEWLAFGEKQRHVTATKMNSASSRSHLLCSIIVQSTEIETQQAIYGKITLCDLAGSERPKKSGVEGDALKEAVEINKSLSALGDVIAALVSKKDKQAPYRNHKLTMLMQDSIGGSAKCLMFVNVSPAESNSEETQNSLTWASRAKQVTNDVKKNADNKEVARLKGVIKDLTAASAANICSVCQAKECQQDDVDEDDDVN